MLKETSKIRWPFRRKHDETDLRNFRNPNTGQLTLRLKGELGFPSGSVQDPLFSLTVNLETEVTDNVARQLRDQINVLRPTVVKQSGDSNH